MFKLMFYSSSLSVSHSIDILREKLLLQLMDKDILVISELSLYNFSFYCPQVYQLTEKQRRRLALKFAKKKAKSRFMERNGE